MVTCDYMETSTRVYPYVESPHPTPHTHTPIIPSPHLELNSTSQLPASVSVSESDARCPIGPDDMTA
jgi:hypothetical protein